METLYFLGIALGGGALALFLSAGWSSFKHKKIPEKGILFRWFVSGLVLAGLIAYVWIFGSGGDMGALMNRVGSALDVENVMKLSTTLGALTAAVGSVTGSQESVAKETEEATTTTTTAVKKEEGDLKIGMPNF